MKSLWNDSEAAAFLNDPLQLRVYSSRLLGRNPDLVLHGGGNTSVKVSETNLFGDTEELLYVKGSGWDLATIEAAGFAPVRMETLLKLSRLNELSDGEMVRLQRAAMTNPNAPNPSVEAILHAIIPFKFVDHTHTDAVVTITNTPTGEARIREVYGDSILVVPYVMPGFILAKTIRDLTAGLDWSKLDGMVLLNHGLFTWSNDARASYEKTIELVTKAEQYLEKHAGNVALAETTVPTDLLKLSTIRKAVSQAWGNAVVAKHATDAQSIGFSELKNATELVNRGPLTPDHIIRTKRTAMVVGDDVAQSVMAFQREYESYFKAHATSETMLDVAPRWAVWPGNGLLAFGRSLKEANIIADINAHTIKAIQQAEKLGGWQALPQKDLFEIEYWELEQAKLKKGGHPLPHQGKIALVTGAASGIGKACVETLVAQGAVVAAIDINPGIVGLFDSSDVLGIKCDLTNGAQLEAAVAQTVATFGGLDILVSNAGIFPASATLRNMDANRWNSSMELNLTSHQRLLTACIPYLELGIDAAVVIVGSKNVPAPGPGAGAYSVAKAGLTQLARVAALELGSKGIRVNTIHPNGVYDTAIWTDEVLNSRAAHYGMTTAEYKTNNVLKTEVTSQNVAELVAAMCSRLFSTITGAQVPIDGGNERVI